MNSAMFVAKDYYINGNRLHCDIWDTGGNPRYRQLIPMYTRGSEIIFVVYDITKRVGMS